MNTDQTFYICVVGIILIFCVYFSYNKYRENIQDRFFIENGYKQVVEDGENIWQKIQE